MQKLLKKDLLLWCAFLIAGMSFVLAFVLNLDRSIVLQVVVELARPKSVSYVDNLLRIAGFVAIGTAFISLFYGLCWYYFSTHLNNPKNSPPILPQTDKSIPLFEYLILLPLLLIALIIRLNSINRGLGYDELFTYQYFVDVEGLWSVISTYIVFNNHITNSVFIYFTSNLFGPSEWAIRLPALLLGFASLIYSWHFARSLLGPIMATMATFGLVILPTHVLWSVSARGYSGFLLFSFVSSVLYLKLLDRPLRSTWVIFVLISVLGIYTHLYAALVTAVQGLFLLYLAVTSTHLKKTNQLLGTRSFRFGWSAFPAIIGISLLCYLPVLPNLVYFVLHRGRGFFRPYFPVELVKSFSGTDNPILYFLTFIIVVFGLVMVWKTYPATAQYFTALALIPLMVIWLSRPFDLYPRFFVYFLPFFVLLMFLGVETAFKFAARKNAMLRYPFQAGLVVFLVLLSYTWVLNSWFKIYDEGYKEAVQTITHNADSTVKFCAFGGSPELFQFYSNRELFIPQSVQEFKQVAEKYSEVRCVYYETDWESEIHTEIAEFLQQHAKKQVIKSFVIFRYQS